MNGIGYAALLRAWPQAKSLDTFAQARAAADIAGHTSHVEKAIQQFSKLAADCTADGEPRKPIECAAIYASAYTNRTSRFFDPTLGLVFLAAIATMLEIEPTTEDRAEAQRMCDAATRDRQAGQYGRSLRPRRMDG